MKIENGEVFNIEGALRGMRFPLNSNHLSDSGYESANFCDANFIIGENDMELTHRLIYAQTPHDKFMRQILVSADITAPLSWWKQMDQYKVGTVTNSESTMHRITSKPITLECFEMSDYEEITYGIGEKLSPQLIIDYCERLRQSYVNTKDKKYWRELIRWLPESWLQKRHWTGDFEILYNIVHQRTGHKLSEWKTFIQWIHTLPYAEELIFYTKEEEGGN